MCDYLRGGTVCDLYVLLSLILEASTQPQQLLRWCKAEQYCSASIHNGRFPSLCSCRISSTLKIRRPVRVQTGLEDCSWYCSYNLIEKKRKKGTRILPKQKPYFTNTHHTATSWRHPQRDRQSNMKYYDTINDGEATPLQIPDDGYFVEATGVAPRTKKPTLSIIVRVT